MAGKRLKHYGWGREGEALTQDEEDSILQRYRERFSVDRFEQVSPPALADINLRAPRVSPPP